MSLRGFWGSHLRMVGCLRSRGHLKHVVLILVLGFILLVIPVQFARLHDDEAIYFVKTGDFLRSLNLPAQRGSTVVPFVLWAAGLLLDESMLSLRYVAALATLSTALVIYFIMSRFSEASEAVISSLLYLFCFHVLRFGIRVALDPFGALFFVLSLLCLLNRRPVSSGISFALAAYSYQFWIPMYFPMALMAWRKRLSAKRFLASSLISASVLELVLISQHGLGVVEAFITYGGPEYVRTTYTAPGQTILSTFLGTAQGWIEFSILMFLPLVGLALWFPWKRARWLVLFLLCQVLIVSLYPGFATYGGMSHYPYGVCLLLTTAAGPGIARGWTRMTRRLGRERLGNGARLIVVLLLLSSQFLTLSWLATSLSTHGVQGVYDLGYSYDVQATAILKEIHRGGLIVGQTTHGLLVDRDQFVWDPYVDSAKLAELNPQVFMGYKTDVIFKGKLPETVKSIEVGPYVIVGAEAPERIGDYVAVAPPDLWAFRSRSPGINQELLMLSLVPIALVALALLTSVRAYRRRRQRWADMVLTPSALSESSRC